jgi:5-formyltetrahydrofolate cyclo-ligase
MMINVEKKSIRKNILAMRNALPDKQIKSMSRSICARFTGLDEVRDCSVMMIFLSFGSEVNTDNIIEWAWQHKKIVLVPLCKPETRELESFPIKTFNDVEPGYFGIREPKKDILKPALKTDVDLVVVPAVAFDRRGYRIGYGGGYYDRFLAGMNVHRIGLAFSCQIIPETPADRYDIPVDGIITEKEYIKATGVV